MRISDQFDARLFVIYKSKQQWEERERRAGNETHRKSTRQFTTKMLIRKNYSVGNF